MKQLLQNYKTGELKVEEVPAPEVQKGEVLVRTFVSLISAGTERTKIETARMNIVEKAISRLDLVKIVLNNIKQEGISFTLKKAFNKLDTPISLGYSCAGKVIKTGGDVLECEEGDRVACVGEIYASHSEINAVPEHFTALIPETVSYEEASFVGLGAIALNAVEISQVQEREKVAVIGLGLIGQIVAQLLKVQGCKSFGIELDEDKIFLAQQLGLDTGASPLKDDVITLSREFSDGKGMDAVIITAASRNNLPLEIAGKISRNKGRVILVGAMPIIIPRKDYYEKEIHFIISRGFGADLYYKEPEDRWYPYNYRPITVKENMQKFLSLLAEKKINVNPLITHRFRLSEAKKAYELIRTNKEKYLGIIFKYERGDSEEKDILVSKLENSFTNKMSEVSELSSTEHSVVNIGFIGAGSFAQGYLLPILKKLRDVNLIGVATKRGMNAKSIVRKFGFNYCTTDYNEVLNDREINCVFIATRHNLHAKLTIEALKKGKYVFVEKPLCISERELKEVISTYRTVENTQYMPKVMVGFNRRFSPFIQKTKGFFKNRVSPLMINYRVNAGYLPSNHWVYHPEEGGGRIVGEMCHFVDLFQCLTESSPFEVFAINLGTQLDDAIFGENIVVSLKFTDGSIGTISYTSNGDSSFSRERLEIFGENSAVVIDNFKKGIFSRDGSVERMRRITRDMGHKDEIRFFINSLLERERELVPFEDIVLTTFTTFKIIEALRKKKVVKIDINEIMPGK